MLTTRQRQALTDAHHISVTANAGSGKTRVLVERYMDILLRGRAEVSQVVALTYTEKAAGELRRKIADAVSTGLGSVTDPFVARRLEQIREHLPAAIIGTIHSFCARVLREYPVEAGVDAAFSVIEGLDQHALLQGAMQETFRSIVHTPSPGALRDRFMDAVRSLGRERVVQTISLLVEKREKLERLTGSSGMYAKDDGEIMAIWREEIAAVVASMVFSPQLEMDLRKIVPALDGKEAETVRSFVGRFLAEGDATRRIALYGEMMGAMIKRDGGFYRVAAGPAVEERLAGEAARLASIRATIEPLLPVFLSSSAREPHLRLLAITRTLLEIARQVVERYEQEKLRSGRLDFEDLQLRTRSLLQREPVRAHLARRFAFVMVDEYQDTNQLQYDLLLPLLSDLATGNLFIVGDPKQSIYAFRDADVAVFNRTRRSIREQCGAGGEVILEESFRPLRDLVAFVNLIFQPLMQGGEEWDVSYDELVQARQNPAPGRVEVILEDDEPGDADPGESEGIARRIHQLVASGAPVYDREERPAPIRFRDFAILLRSRTMLPEIEGTFSRLAVPFVVSAGVGYFQTQDILDFYNYLEFLVHPSDDTALAGVLRSPFFSIPDTELFEVGGGTRRVSLWRHIRRQGEQNALPPGLAEAVKELAEDLDISLRLPVSAVIARIVRRRAYLGKIGGTPRGPQALANLEKLQRMARSYELQGFTTLFDFVQRLRRLINEEEDEGQGVSESQTDAVRIMTVHAAKGLEFPCVVIPHLHRPFRRDEEPFVDARLGIGVSLRDAGGGTADPPLTAFLREQSRRRVVAEEKRIFYVACTRARDLLLLSGNILSRRAGGSWGEWLCNGLGLNERIEGETLSRPVTLGKTPDGFRTAAGLLTVHLLRRSALPVPMPVFPSPTQPPASPLTRVEPLKAQWKGEIFSATRIKAYRDCPAGYYLKYVLGLPWGHGRGEHLGDEELEDHAIPADLRGRVFHAVMQKIDEIGVHPERLQEEVQKALLLQTPVDSDRAMETIADIATTVRSVTASAFWREVAAGREVRTEFTISLALGEDYLSGTIDRMYRDVSGGWHVLDYKTDRVDAGTLGRRAETYWPQLEFYAFLVHRYLSLPTVTATLLFTSLPELPVRRIFAADLFGRFEAEVLEIIGRIRAGDFRPGKVPCEGCPLAPRGCRFA